MTPLRRKLLAVTATALATVGLAACGSHEIELASDDPNRKGAELFRENCAGCHTLDVAGTQGSAIGIEDRERVDGPTFNQRKETVEQVLYAIRNGGFSGAVMPENIVTGEEAQAVAEFLAKYSGQDADDPPTPTPSKTTPEE